MMKKYILISILLVSFCMWGCKKEFLDKKPSLSVIVPTGISDFRALMDDPYIFIYYGMPMLGTISADDFVTSEDMVSILSVPERGAYLWEKNMDGNDNDWYYGYQQVFNSNLVLDGLAKMEGKERGGTAYRNLQGTALFWRSFAFSNLLEGFAKSFDSKTADRDLGIPLRTSSDVNVKFERESVRKGFDKIIADLKQAVDLLPNVEKHRSRPTRNCALALLARVYLIMGDYKNAGYYADLSLQENSTLLDYSTLDPNAPRPFPLGLGDSNPEILLYTCMTRSIFLQSTLTGVVPELFDQYEDGDLRKKLYFEDSGFGYKNFKGSYTGDSEFFAGLTTREQYLIRAECHARLGNVESAMVDLNNLLVTRWDDTFVDLKAYSKEEAISKILNERRKELVGQGLRFSDLRRLNLETERAVTLTRKVNGVDYYLPPNDNRYVFLIPFQEVQMTGIPQNIR
ncbi:RagB/SusD family nutrient uptake outer membrane protein [Sphingobacterium thalpophilum]|uniref:RagB/SusD family nutrient uptake outer membrane protein n=1 Tax=Sphingobacterium thalpophilum TaxID=259 RepID=UPI002D782D48|nr:RagB/SusD family nutrient uptake outer membrane protein [Sphingobacterium thalpophilum]